jgi:hypothetical protein
MKIINFFFGKMICACVGHDKVAESVMRCKDGHQVVFWCCTRCGIDNYRDR